MSAARASCTAASSASSGVKLSLRCCARSWGIPPGRRALCAERGWPRVGRAEFEREIEAGSLYVGAPDTVARRIAATVRTLGLDESAFGRGRCLIRPDMDG